MQVRAWRTSGRKQQNQVTEVAVIAKFENPRHTHALPDFTSRPVNRCTRPHFTAITLTRLNERLMLSNGLFPSRMQTELLP